MADLSSQIETAAASPKKASGDGVSVEMPSIAEMIEADRHLATKTAAGKKRHGIRLSRIVNPAASEHG